MVRLCPRSRPAHWERKAAPHLEHVECDDRDEQAGNPGHHALEDGLRARGGDGHRHGRRVGVHGCQVGGRRELRRQVAPDPSRDGISDVTRQGIRSTSPSCYIHALLQRPHPTCELPVKILLPAT